MLTAAQVIKAASDVQIVLSFQQDKTILHELHLCSSIAVAYLRLSKHILPHGKALGLYQAFIQDGTRQIREREEEKAVGASLREMRLVH